MKLEEKYTIDDKIVTKIGNISSLDIFSLELDYDVRLYFVTKKGEVLGTIDITAGCGQNTGYIDEIIINNLK